LNGKAVQAKLEYQNSKQIQKSNVKMTQTIRPKIHGYHQTDFSAIVSDFDIRISNL
jgi:hypothetical protein